MLFLKYLIGLCALISGLHANATSETLQIGRDSVAVFYSPEKINILINERGANQRLHLFMDAMGWGENHYWANPEETLKIHCAREEQKGVCVFTLKPSEFVKFNGKSAEAHFTEGSFNATPYEMTFESSMQDKFSIKVDGSNVSIWANKKKISYARFNSVRKLDWTFGCEH